ncbi:polymer-forming cytoskeletal protein [Massilia sp. SR12]
MTWTLLFFTSLALLFVLPLLPALLEWRLKRDALPLQVVREHDGNIKHFAKRFHEFVVARFAQALDAAAASPAPRAGRLDSGDAYQLVGAAGVPDLPSQEASGQSLDVLVLGAADLRLGSGTLYEKEVYARADIRSGDGNSFRALLAGGEIVLGADCDVLRWAHSDSRLVAGARSRLFGRVSADRELVLHGDTRFGRMHAPTIRFGDTAPAGTVPAPVAPLQYTPLQRPDHLLDDAAGRWLLGGDWALPDHARHAGSLVARGSMTVGAQAWVEGSIKCHGDLVLQAGTRIDGALVCSGDMTIGPGCVIGGPLVCEQKIMIEAGTVLGSLAVETTATASEIRVREGVVVHGTVWARELGYVAPAGIVS